MHHYCSESYNNIHYTCSTSLPLLGAPIHAVDAHEKTAMAIRLFFSRLWLLLVSLLLLC